nr:MAG TPA_asm: hypothetical protein [Caudoviricetes sp.]
MRLQSILSARNLFDIQISFSCFNRSTRRKFARNNVFNPLKTQS